MNELSSALFVLSAMITPAVLILASSSLILATSARLGRVVDRTRKLSDWFEELARGDEDLALIENRRSILFDQLDKATARARILQRAMTVLYLALALLLADTVAIGVDAATRQDLGWAVVGLALAAVGLMLYGSVLLIVESRVALAAVDSEMDFVRRLGKHLAPSDLLKEPRKRAQLFRKPRI